MRHYTLAVIALSLLAAPATADMIPVLNPGFEIPVLPSPGSFTSDVVPDWVTSGNTGVLWPTAAMFPAGAPEGRNVAGAGDAGEAGSISQVLAATLESNTVYTLQVDVGQRLDFPFASYTVALIANGVTLASDSSLSPSPGTFLTDTIQYNSGSNPAQLGQSLEIVLSATAGGQALFDDVRINAFSLVPDPSSLALCGVGFLALVVFKRCRDRRCSVSTVVAQTGLGRK